MKLFNLLLKRFDHVCVLLQCTALLWQKNSCDHDWQNFCSAKTHQWFAKFLYQIMIAMSLHDTYLS